MCRLSVTLLRADSALKQGANLLSGPVWVTCHVTAAWWEGFFARRRCGPTPPLGFPAAAVKL